MNNSSNWYHYAGNLTHDISAYSTVDYQFNATANTGDSGSLNGTFHICDYLEKMHQPPNSSEPEKACPPSKGPVFIDYAFWFADILVAPVCIWWPSSNETNGSWLFIGSMERQTWCKDARGRQNLLPSNRVRPPVSSRTWRSRVSAWLIRVIRQTRNQLDAAKVNTWWDLVKALSDGDGCAGPFKFICHREEVSYLQSAEKQDKWMADIIFSKFRERRVFGGTTSMK